MYVTCSPPSASYRARAKVVLPDPEPPATPTVKGPEAEGRDVLMCRSKSSNMGSTLSLVRPGGSSMATMLSVRFRGRGKRLRTEGGMQAAKPLPPNDMSPSSAFPGGARGGDV